MKPEQIEKLAKEFSRILWRDIGHDNMQAVILENKEDTNCCATHNFIDSNMAMLEALINCEGKYDDNLFTEFSDLMNAAWDIAKANEFYDAATLVYPRPAEQIWITGAGSDEHDKKMDELGAAVMEAEQLGLNCTGDVFCVGVNGKEFGFAQAGSWEAAA